MFSIIVPTFNRASVCSLAVESLLAQDANFPYEVIVVDNNSTDATKERIEALCKRAPERLRYVFEKKQGVSAARNTGIAAARGDIIAFVDDDVIAHPGWLIALAETYRTHPDAWCVGGKIVLKLPEALPAWFDHRSRILTSHLGRLDLGDATIERRYPNEVFGGNFSVRRDVLDRVGCFDTTLGPAGRWRIESEETDLCWRVQQAGGPVYYCGRAVVAHVVPDARMTKRYFRERAWWGGRTWALLRRKQVVEANSEQLVRLAMRVIRNLIKSWLSPSTVDRLAIFEDELRFWHCLGYLSQAFLMRFSLRRRARDRARESHQPV